MEDKTRFPRIALVFVLYASYGKSCCWTFKLEFSNIYRVCGRFEPKWGRTRKVGSEDMDFSTSFVQQLGYRDFFDEGMINSALQYYFLRGRVVVMESFGIESISRSKVDMRRRDSLVVIGNYDRKDGTMCRWRRKGSRLVDIWHRGVSFRFIIRVMFWETVVRRGVRSLLAKWVVGELDEPAS
ncbi:hypothetical protein L1887_13611 [Cichorium endivia]|nr:hypothetical protein L1887_13611 [Cichorium endivia]